MQGADHGKKSVVIKVSRKTNRVVVRGIKLVRYTFQPFHFIHLFCIYFGIYSLSFFACLLQAKRRIKATEESQGGFVYREQPIHYSNVSLVDPSDGCVACACRVLRVSCCSCRVRRSRLC
jgi:ribosomal protein L24